MADPNRHDEEIPGPPPFDEVFAGLSKTLKRHLEKMVRNAADAEDLLQETWIRIARGLPSFEGRSSVKTWAFRIADRVVIDHFRKAAAVRDFVEWNEEAYPAPDNTLEGLMERKESSECVREEVEKLSPKFREALLLHDFRGFTAAETAEAAGSSVPTAKIRIHRARRSLRDALHRKCRIHHGPDRRPCCTRRNAAV